MNVLRTYMTLLIVVIISVSASPGLAADTYQLDPVHSSLVFRIKHLGVARRTDNGIEMRVHPTLIPEKRLIANVDGVMNAVLVKADAVGPTLYYGAGAGAEPTASAESDTTGTPYGSQIAVSRAISQHWP